MELVECSTCGKRVQPSKGYRCPHCNSFLHPDPIKRQEAELADALRDWFISELPKHPDILPSDFTLDPEKLEDLSFHELTESLFKVLDASQLSLPSGAQSLMFPVFALGDDTSKKSEYIRQSTNAYFYPHYKMSLGTSFAVKNLVAQNFRKKGFFIKLQIWDVSGVSHLKTLRQRWYELAHGALLFFHRAVPRTFKQLESWVDEYTTKRPDDPFVLVGLLGGEGNTPAKHLISKADIEKFAFHHQTPYFEFILDKNESVEGPWEKLTELMLMKTRIYNEEKT